MKIEIARLREGIDVSFCETWNPEELDLGVVGQRYAGVVEVTALARKDAGIVVVEVTTRAKAVLTCARCFKESDARLDKEFRFVYPLEQAKREIVLDDDIRQELILDTPLKILCRPECLGLCARCGADLNEGKCKCGV